MQALLPAILNNLERMLDVLVRDGFGPLESAYLDAWLHTGQQVQASPLQARHSGHIHGHSSAKSQLAEPLMLHVSQSVSNS